MSGVRIAWYGRSGVFGLCVAVRCVVVVGVSLVILAEVVEFMPEAVEFILEVAYLRKESMEVGAMRVQSRLKCLLIHEAVSFESFDREARTGAFAVNGVISGKMSSTR